VSKNILITGAGGFIGKNLVEHLKDKSEYSLFYPYHKELELLDAGAVSDYVKTNKIDIIIHCANIGGSRKTRYDNGKEDITSKNLGMFLNLAKTLDSDRSMIHLGSGAEYDFRSYAPKMKEDYFGTHIPEDSLGLSKYLCSKYIMSAERITNLRFFGVFGRYEDYEYRFISNAIVKNLLGLPIVINQNVYFDYMYVDDAARIIEYFIGHKAKHQFYNATTGRAIDLVTIANKINKVSKYPSEVVINNPGLNLEYSGDNTRLLKEMDNFNFTSFDAALKELYNWYKARTSEIDKEKIVRDEYIKYCRVKNNG